MLTNELTTILYIYPLFKRSSVCNFNYIVSFTKNETLKPNHQTNNPADPIGKHYLYILTKQTITYSKVTTVTSQIGCRSTTLLYNENMFSLFALYLHS